MRRHTLGYGLIALIVAIGSPSPAVAGREADKATEVLAAARKAIGEKKLASLKTFGAEGKLQRNVGTFQMSSDVELAIELPDKYARTEVSGSPMNMERTTGFSGNQSLQAANSPGAMGAGGAMIIRMGPGGPGGPAPSGEKPTPEQLEQMNKAALRATRAEVSRLMLGWFAMAHPSITAVYSYAGQAESPDGKADLIDVTGADGFAARLFIDQQTHLPLMVTYQGPQARVITRTGGPAPSGENAERRVSDVQGQPMPMVEYRLFFSEWADVDGVAFPHKIQRSTGGVTEEEWTITRAKVNPTIDPKKFQVKS